MKIRSGLTHRLNIIHRELSKPSKSYCLILRYRDLSPIFVVRTLVICRYTGLIFTTLVPND